MDRLGPITTTGRPVTRTEREAHRAVAGLLGFVLDEAMEAEREGDRSWSESPMAGVDALLRAYHRMRRAR